MMVTGMAPAAGIQVRLGKAGPDPTGRNKQGMNPSGMNYNGMTPLAKPARRTR